MSNIEEKFFVRSFIRFLNGQLGQPNLSSNSRESLGVAIQCLENVNEIGQEEGDNSHENPLNHIDLFEVYQSTLRYVSPKRKQEAENLKNEGNRLIKEKKYQEAMNTYSKAISEDATNPVFYCNRAAAYTLLGDYQSAADDCHMSLRYDPNYSKAYGRLGLAYSKMNKYAQALEAYQNALRIQPDNQDYKNNVSVTHQRLEQHRSVPIGAGGDEGLTDTVIIDYTAALNNPAINSLFTRIMDDPSVQNMMGQLGGINSMRAALLTGRLLSEQMRSHNPDVFANVIYEMEQSGALFRGSTRGANQNGNNNNQQPPPPPPAES
ncbi:small glutamine-rich tetratricopeptide repeat-containing protein beta-like [Ochlerotatus camptorhynchus]|uniref:small glutamine-rich tetratricopeptide repeat-containing protein beta-like n=1 Tax=Ochlerotatus camptorhynchus TaxID=644619 RepID=UPI0031D68EDF